jgi:hypothetical protein
MRPPLSSITVDNLLKLASSLEDALPLSTCQSLTLKGVHQNPRQHLRHQPIENSPSFIHDPTAQQHVPNDLHCIATLIERLAGSKPLDVRQDKELKSWFDEFFKYVRKDLDEPGYAQSQRIQEATQGVPHEMEVFT